MGARVWRRADAAPSTTQDTGGGSNGVAPTTASTSLAHGHVHRSKEIQLPSRTCQSSMTDQQQAAALQGMQPASQVRDAIPTGQHTQHYNKPSVKHKTGHVSEQQHALAATAQAQHNHATYHNTALRPFPLAGNRAQQNHAISKTQRHVAQNNNHYSSQPHHSQAHQHTGQAACTSDDISTQPPRAKRPRIASEPHPGGQHTQHSQLKPKPAVQQKVDLAAELSSKMAAMEELKRQLQEKEAEIAKQKEIQAAKEAARLQQLQQQQQQQEEAMKRKVQLARGFKSLASATGQTSSTGEGSKTASMAAAAQTKGPSVPAADEWEVARVLHSKNDYECLQLHVGASLAQVRRSYKSMAMSLHPDRCKISGASEAFQRLKKAYDHLSDVTS